MDHIKNASFSDMPLAAETKISIEMKTFQIRKHTSKETSVTDECMCIIQLNPGAMIFRNSTSWIFAKNLSAILHTLFVLHKTKPV